MKKIKTFTCLVATVIVLGFGMDLSAQPISQLEKDFKNPPQKGRLQAMWFWQGTEFSKEGITKDLEAMKAAGLGAALILHLNSGTDNHVWPENLYRSEKYWEALLHAAKEADRLGMTIGSASSPGYTGTGGPWISESQNMRRLAWTQQDVDGDRIVEITLPKPALVPGSTHQKTQAQSSIYEEIAVLAVPNKKEFLLTDIQNLTDKIQSGGKLVWNAPKGKWSIYRIGYIPTLEEGHPLPEGLSGPSFEVDKLSREDNVYYWKNVIAPLKEHLGKYFGTSFNVLHIDSYECGTQNWTPKFKEEFIKRKGYDPTPWLVTFGTPILGYKFGQYNGQIMDGMPRDGKSKIIDSEDKTKRFEWDFCDVISRLFNDNILEGKKIMNREKIKFSYEPYGGPFNYTEAATIADIPMATFWTTTDFDYKRKAMNGTGIIGNWFTGAVRATGRKVINCESFTSMPNVSRWTEDPADLKLIADGAFSSGVNQLMFHQWVHQPFDDKYQPGMTNMWWGVHFSRHQTWLKPAKAFFDYLNRCQALLQQGEEVVDHLCIERSDDYSDLLSMYHFMQDSTKVVNGQIVLSSGRKYYYLVCPKDGEVLPEIALKIERLVHAGATIVSDKFTKSPSLKDFPASDEIIKLVDDRVWGTKATKDHVFASVDEARKKLLLQPDYEVISSNYPKEVRVLHRHSTEADIYFVANRSSKPQNLSIKFRVQGKQPELWQAEDLTIADAPVWDEQDQRTSVGLNLRARQTVFVVFRKPIIPKLHITSVSVTDTSVIWSILSDKNGKPIFRSAMNATAKVIYSTGKEKIVETKQSKPFAITGSWDVSFVPKLGEKFHLQFPELVDFSKYDGKEVNYFSGTATYRKEIVVKAEMLNSDKQIILDLGELNDIVSVKVNGDTEIILWYPPYKTDIGKFLKAGRNLLEIAVTNNWANAIIGDEQIPADFESTPNYRNVGNPMKTYPDWFIKNLPRPTARKYFSIWNYYYKDSQLQPAGLLGPVQLVVEEKVKL